MLTSTMTIDELIERLSKMKEISDDGGSTIVKIVCGSNHFKSCKLRFKKEVNEDLSTNICELLIVTPNNGN